MLDKNLIELQRVASTLKLSLDEVLVIFNILQANTLITLRDVLEEVEQNRLDPFTRLDILKNKLNGYIAKAMYEANAAVFMAGEALEIAEEAEAKSDTAIDQSNTAISISNIATNTAVEAKNTAESAYERSNTAIDTSHQAITNSNTAISVSNAASELVNTLDEKITDVNVTATQASNKATQGINLANEALLNTLDNSNRITTLELEEHFKGYYSTTDELNAVDAKNGDYAYNAETGTKWIYNNGWSDSLTPVPDKTVPASDSIPLVDNGSGSVGISTSYARGDHVHPTDVTRASTTQLTNLESNITVQLGTKVSNNDFNSYKSTVTTELNTKRNITDIIPITHGGTNATNSNTAALNIFPAISTAPRHVAVFDTSRTNSGTIGIQAFRNALGLGNTLTGAVPSADTTTIETTTELDFNNIMPSTDKTAKTYFISVTDTHLNSPIAAGGEGWLSVYRTNNGRAHQIFVPTGINISSYHRQRWSGGWEPTWVTLEHATFRNKGLNDDIPIITDFIDLGTKKLTRRFQSGALQRPSTITNGIVESYPWAGGNGSTLLAYDVNNAGRFAWGQLLWATSTITWQETNLFQGITTVNTVSVDWNNFDPTVFDAVFGANWTTTVGMYYCRGNIVNGTPVGFSGSYAIQIRVWLANFMEVKLTDDNLNYFYWGNFGIAGAVKTFQKISNVLTNMTGTLPIANGGTGGTTRKTAFTSLFPTNYSSDYSTVDYIPVRQYDGSGGDTGFMNKLKFREMLGLGDTLGALPIANGGTGGTTVSSAISKLFPNPQNTAPDHVMTCMSGWNSPSTTTMPNLRNALGLGNTTGALSIVNGGTGAITASAALANLGGLPLTGGILTGSLLLNETNYLKFGNKTGLKIDLFNDAKECHAIGVDNSTTWYKSSNYHRFYKRDSGSLTDTLIGEINTSGFSGKGSQLTELNASNISSGTIHTDRLPTVPIDKGGTGTTSRKGAILAFFNNNADSNLSAYGRVMVASNDFELSGHFSFSALKTALGITDTSNALPLSGGTMTGTINSSAGGSSYVNAAQGNAIISSTKGHGSFIPIATGKSTNGAFVTSVYQNNWTVYYVTKANMDAGNNTVTTAMNFSEGGTLYAPYFSGNGSSLTQLNATNITTGILSTARGGTGNTTGNATTATTLQTSRQIALTGAVTGSAYFNGSANISINTTGSGFPAIPISGTGTALGTLKTWISKTAPTTGTWAYWGSANNDSGSGTSIAGVATAGSSITAYTYFTGFIWRIA